MNALERAFLAAAEGGGGEPKIFEVGPEADVRFADGSHPFENLTATHWTHD